VLGPLLAREQRRVVALLARRLGLTELALAEDAVQTAALRALQRWPQDGVPDRPAAWLYRVAEHWALDQLRAAGRHVPLPDDDAGLLPPHAPPAGRFAGELDDDELALLFAACHPALPVASQVLLALRCGAGLSLAQLAPLLFSNEVALAQRLARARARLAGYALTLPAGAELAPRREAVLTALSLVFLQGQLAAGRAGDAAAVPGAHEACWEAIRLARALAAHPASAAPEADALAALLLLHGARLSGRIDARGDPIPLAGQPRERWDAGMVRLGLRHLQASQRGDRLSRWHLQAGIAAEHALAPTPEATRWGVIVRYYELLVALDPSQAPRLGHAIALAEAGQSGVARERLLALLPELPAALRAHGLAALARAAVHAGDDSAAIEWLTQAVACAPDAAQARLLQARAKALLRGADLCAAPGRG
jgi:RNA polymerase sigma-70 factor (ECF subfamily)